MPSNLERIRNLYGDDVNSIRHGIEAKAIGDEEIKRTIEHYHQRFNLIICPHTACGLAIWDEESPMTIVAATAHPAKFDSIVEPLVNRQVEIPENLAKLLALPNSVTEIPPTLRSLQQEVQACS